MMALYYDITSFPNLAHRLLLSEPIHTGEWQSLDTSNSKAHATYELMDVTVSLRIPPEQSALEGLLRPDMPWANEHFAERVSGIPHNPPPSAARWPYAVRGNADHTDPAGWFDHTYPERYWPRHAGHDHSALDTPDWARSGIRFEYGDLSDVVRLLIRSPLTRQAYLPVWFPEDTGGSAHKGPYDPDRDGDPSPIRVPCTLGYHFMIRDGHLSCRYYLRSCDMRRHFINDLYFAGRLMQWICQQISHDVNAPAGDSAPFVRPGQLITYISSFHCFVGDVQAIKERFIAPFTFRQASPEGIPR